MKEKFRNEKVTQTLTLTSACKFLFISLLMSFSIQAKAAITEKKFHEILDRLSAMYREDIFKVTGRKLELIRHWNTNNQFSTDSSLQHPLKETSDIVLTANLAQHQEITADAFTLVACHEFGHHLGGFPKQPQILVQWSSVEGQADYWGAEKCLRRYFEEYPDSGVSNKSLFLKVPGSLRSQCERKFASTSEQFLCMRMMAAAVSLSNYFNVTSSKRNPTSFATPESLVVKKTKIKYGSNQCRIDTFIAASLCDRSSRQEEACEEGEEGARPHCWFAPQIF